MVSGMPKNNKYINIYKIIGNNIKRIRKEQGLTGEKLSNLCNLSYGYIRNLESSKVNATISIETLSLIAEKLDCDITDLLKNED